MSPHRTRQLRVLLSLLMLALSGLLLWWGLSDTPSASRHPHSTVRSLPQSDLMDVSVRPESDRLTAQSFTPLLEKPLRRVLYDPPPPPKPPPPEKKPPPPVRATLMATMIEPEQSMAMLRLNSGEVVFRKPGDLVSADDGTAVIADIQPGLVTVQQGDHVTELRLNGQR